MAAYENVRNLTVLVAVANGVPAALMYRFAKFDPAAGEDFAVITHVPGANGEAADGILAMKPDPKGTGFVASSIALPDGGQCLVELGQACAKGDLLRVGGNGAEVDGAAYKADAAGDIIVAKALSAGVVGQIIPIQFYGYRGSVP
jgi:hypothetical protein